MTVSTSTNSVTYVATGATNTFDYDFVVYDESHFVITLDGVEVTSGFTVTGVGDESGGTVVFDTNPTGTLAILRQVPYTQDIDYSPYDPFPAQTHERGLDLAAMRDQQLKTSLDEAESVLDSLVDEIEEIRLNVGGRPTFIQATPPLTAIPSDRWFCTADGRTYIRYDDGDSVQWVDNSPQGGSTTSAVSSVNGLTGEVVLTTANVADSTDKRFVTDAQKVVLGNTSGANTGDETKSSIETKLSGSSVVTLAGNTFNGSSQLVRTTADGKLPAIDGSLLTNLPVGSGAVDSVNGKTGTVVLTTANIADSTNKRYVTDAGLAVLGNTSGSNTGDETQGSIETKLAGSTTVTLAGNVFNGNSQLVQTTADGKLPVIDGSNLINLPSSTGTGDVSSVNGKTGNVVLTTADIADSTNKRYVTDTQQTVITNTSGTNTGDETQSSIETKLSGSSVVTLAGNAFNGASQLVQTTAAGKLPALDGSLLTNLPSGSGGVVASADKLTTPRSINGTPFDGTTDISTSNWGTSRTFTIGGVSKSVNGSSNVSWSAGELGCLPSTGGSLSGKLTITSGGLEVSSLLRVFNADYPTKYCSLGIVDDVASIMAASTITPGLKLMHGDSTYFYVSPSGQLYAQGVYMVYHTNNKPTASDVGALPASGTAVAATKLATARTIAGKSFDGTANISITAADVGALSTGGGTLSGDLNTSGTIKLTNPTATAGLSNSFGRNIVRGSNVATNVFGNTTDAMYFDGNSLTAWQVRYNSTLYPIYHTGNKPTPAEIGAQPATSDIRVKSNIASLSPVLDKIMLIDPKTFTMEGRDGTCVGTIAQDWEVDFPEVILNVPSTSQEEPEMLKGIDALGTIGILLKAIQELKGEIEDLKNR